MAIPGPLPRRLITVSLAFASAMLISIVLLPVLPVLAVSDALRSNRGALSRAFLMLWILTIYESVGVFGAGVLWLARWVLRPTRPTWERWNMNLTYRWGGGLFAWIVFLYSLDVRVTGEDSLRAPGPVLFLMRHSGIVDTLVSPAVISLRNGRPLRYVVKDGLLWDPCLDIMGSRFPNVFVRRNGVDTEAQIGAITDLARSVGETEGVLIYPEGTRFTESKRQRIIEKLRKGGALEALARAESLRRVLPPRRGGTLAVLQAAPHADVIVAANTGFEWATSKRQFWSGQLIGRTIHVDFQRVPAADVPRDDAEAMEWLSAAWGRVDDWVQEHEDRS